MATFAPCGCEGASVYVDTLQFEHVGGLSGADALNPITIKLAPDKIASLGGPNGLKTDAGGGLYVSSCCSYTLNDTSTVDIVGNGTTVPWTANVKVSATPLNALSVVGDGLYVQGSTIAIAPGGCDEQLFSTGIGVSAGPRHYTISSFHTAEIGNDDLIMPISATQGAKDINALSMTLANPSNCRTMRAMWTFVFNLPYVNIPGGQTVFMSLNERSWISGTATPSYGSRVRAFESNSGSSPEIRHSSPLVYAASGSIPPGKSLFAQARLNIFTNSPGGLSYVDPSGFALPVRARVDGLASTT